MRGKKNMTKRATMNVMEKENNGKIKCADVIKYKIQTEK